MNLRIALKRRLFSGVPIVVVLCTLLSIFSSYTASVAHADTGPLPPPVQNPVQIRGIQGEPETDYTGMSWLRLGYPTCGWGNLKGDVLKKTIRSYHEQGVRILLTVCQGPNDAHLYDTAPLKDAAQGMPDAVQCGNEEMKTNDPNVSFLYIPPERFAHFYDLCEHAVHAVRADIPVLLGSLDPHVGGIDFGPLMQQVQYLDRMQVEMNKTVHPGGHWDWHTQTLGLIDTWHNGYPTTNTNSLYGLFVFWAGQFHVNLDKGELGKHLWVVEGTGCFIGCGIDANSPYQVAVVHILDLITNVLTATRYGIAYFHFSGRDFISVGIKWPIGVLDVNGNHKPLRQDLPMGARTLTMLCSRTFFVVQTQEDLLLKMYKGCKLPGNYISILES